MEKMNGREMKYISGSNRIVYTDASETGYGGYCTCVQTGNAVSNGLYGKKARERRFPLVAVERVLCSLLPFLEGEDIKWFTDK